MPERKPLKIRELRKRLKDLGIVEFPGNGKNHAYFCKPDREGKPSAPFYTVKDHGDHTELTIPVLKALCRTLGISENDLWK